MNDDELTRMLHAATEEVHATDRLDDLLARKRPGRRRIVAGLVAAALLVAVALAVVVRDATSPQRVTTYEPSPSSTVVGGPRLGDEITVAEAALPADVRLLDELPRSIGPEYTVVSRFARDASLWNGAGPYVRVTLTRADGLGETWAETDRGTARAEIDGQPAYLSSDAPGEGSAAPGSDPSGDLSEAWLTLAWSPGPDEVIQVQGKGLDPSALVTVAESVRIRS